MTNPTRKEIIEAYREIDMLLGHYDDRNPGRVPECRAIIEKALPPRPQPTMADVVWNDEEHFLAEARIKNGPLVAMIGKDQEQWITCIPIETDYSLLCKRTEFEGYLTPTGKHYRLQEAQDD
ncbi:hypothetical protein WM42_2005 [Corynebacterium simulans]|uniref:hypothetical protein n=1 Tax=Corynebacterium simulans TaxID=146827 RepID=UPI000786805D|nr:hypothetical protein [Corynebacterium simulans]AMO89707.1 hypothetical protein WM42_2005 [Corynebacterium simulans]